MYMLAGITSNVLSGERQENAMTYSEGGFSS